MKAWEGFNKGIWQDEITVRDFIQKNYTPYEGDDTFLRGSTLKTKVLWNKIQEAQKEEILKGVLDIETDRIAGINEFEPGYIDKDNEVIVGLQTDELFKRIINPYGGFRMVNSSLNAYDYKLNPKFDNVFTKYRKTHNDGVFDAYTEEIRRARRAGLITGLPDAYGRGRIIGDYRRVALYGTDKLIKEKQKDHKNLLGDMTEDRIRLREEVAEQIKALHELNEMADGYGFDVRRPAENAFEAVQWLYLAYLAAIKENNGAAMSLGRVSSFLDIYIEKDLRNNVITEEEAQELIDQFVLKLRVVRHLRTPEYDELFSGDPTWVTEAIGGMGIDGRTLVTKSSFRMLHTLINLDPAPEPNITVLWSEKLPENFKRFCAKVSILTDSIQYENDDVMRPIFGDDYGIACCVSAMAIGEQMQYFGARCNLVKALLYSLNGGIDEMSGEKVLENVDFNTSEVLEYEKVKEDFFKVIEKVAKTYVDAMNIIHYMHDKYAYEKSQLALHNTDVQRLMAFGVAGLSVAADSLSAIKYAKVEPIRNEQGVAIDFKIEGDYPKYGNDDDRVDNIAVELTEKFFEELSKHPIIRNAKPTLSVLTITSNVVYGKTTGATPDGRRECVPFAPGANPMHGRDTSGALASLNSVAKIKYEGCCEDGISNTFTIVPNALGTEIFDRCDNLVSILDGYFAQGAHHLNVNVLNRDTLIDAMNNPEEYPLLTIRVSGYAVRFNRLTKEQQQEVIDRTFHGQM